MSARETATYLLDLVCSLVEVVKPQLFFRLWLISGCLEYRLYFQPVLQ